MKKRFILSLAALATLALTSCQKDLVVNQVPEETPIAFGTYLGRDAVTKGSVLDDDALASGGFGVYAYYTTEAWNTAISQATKPTPNFMKNQKVYIPSTSTSWTYTPTKYWPTSNDAKLTFFAYAPYSVTSPVNTETSNCIPSLNVVVDSDISKHIDYTYAVENWTGANTPTSLFNLNKDAGKIELLFKHAMSRVGFTVKNNILADDASTSISVTSIQVKGTFVKENSFALNDGTWGDSPSTATYAFNLNNNNNLSVNTDNYTVNKYDSYLFLIPQTNSNFSITVSYTVTTIDPAFDTIIGGDGKVEFSNTVTTNQITHTFEAGKAYNFVLTVGLDAITFNAVVDDWNTDLDGNGINDDDITRNI